jgi:hypothetical protein
VSEANGLGIDMIETFDFGLVHNNLAIGGVAMKVGGWPEKPDDGSEGGWPSHCEVFNNIFDGTVWVDDFATRQGNIFDHNHYRRVRICWGGRENGPKFWDGSHEGTFPPDEYATLDAFRKATEQEAHDGARPIAIAREWLAARAKLLTETGASAYGIPMEPETVTRDFRGAKFDPDRTPPIGPVTQK